jgi:hypothetical protein
MGKIMRVAILEVRDHCTQGSTAPGSTRAIVKVSLGASFSWAATRSPTRGEIRPGLTLGAVQVRLPALAPSQAAINVPAPPRTPVRLAPRQAPARAIRSPDPPVPAPTAGS